MTRSVKYRDIVRRLALENYGFVTTRMAADGGVPVVELPKLCARGGLESVAYGLYRVTDVPVSAFDQFAEALFRVGGRGILVRRDGSRVARSRRREPPLGEGRGCSACAP